MVARARKSDEPTLRERIRAGLPSGRRRSAATGGLVPSSSLRGPGAVTVREGTLRVPADMKNVQIGIWNGPPDPRLQEDVDPPT